MKNSCLSTVAAALLLIVPAVAQQTPNTNQANQPTHQTGSQVGTPILPALADVKYTSVPGDRETNRIAKEARHELVMLPYYTIWDWLAFSVKGDTVTLYGSVVNASLRSDAENAVKGIEGVEKVDNQIKTLAPSPADARIREAAARSIFSFGNLSRYSWAAVPSLHIIVSGGNITLEGVVNSEEDKNAAGIRANQVQGAFKVTNNLVVLKGA